VVGFTGDSTNTARVFFRSALRHDRDCIGSTNVVSIPSGASSWVRSFWVPP
jgi:hypothetical protein